MYYFYVTNKFIWEYEYVGWIGLQGKLEGSYKDGQYTDDGYILMVVINHQVFPLQRSLTPPFFMKGSIFVHFREIPLGNCVSIGC